MLLNNDKYIKYYFDKFFCGGWDDIPSRTPKEIGIDPIISRDLKTMDDTLMYIPNDDTQNYPFCKLKLHNELTFQNSTVVPTVVVVK